MSYYVRSMRQEDVAKVAEIDREAFPTQYPPPNYQHELRNRLAHYIVACDDEKVIESPEEKTPPDSTGPDSILKRLFGRNRPSHHELSPPPDEHYIVGFAGFWVMADETHITSIAVREAYHRRGLGELLIIPIMDMAKALNTRIVTLEVRASNTIAHNLYVKYGFTQVGVRWGYYTDNREDAFVMSTQDITSATFQAHLEKLKQDYSKKRGIALTKITL